MTMKNMRLIHYTNWRNIESIRLHRVLHCAFSMMSRCERECLAGKRRAEGMRLESGVHVRDQEPMDSEHSNTPEYAKFVRLLNKHVFFWSPDIKESEEHRERFCRKYPYPKWIGLRCWLDDLRAENHADIDIRYSPRNAGDMRDAPKDNPIYLDLFQPLEGRDENKPLVEVVVRGKVCLPQSTEVECDDGKWHLFFRP